MTKADFIAGVAEVACKNRRHSDSKSEYVRTLYRNISGQQIARHSDTFCSRPICKDGLRSKVFKL